MVKDLRRIIREAVVDRMRLPAGPNSRDNGDGEGMHVGEIDEVYMSPKNVRGIGPDVDMDQEWGTISSTDAAVRFPKAVRSLVRMYLSQLMPEDIVDLFGTDRPYPKDVADLFDYSLEDGKLKVSGGLTNDHVGTWNPKTDQWDDGYLE